MIAHLMAIAQVYANWRGVSVARVAKLARGSGDFFARLQGGASCTIRTYNRVLQWFSDHWPSDLEWPSDIPRPDPAPDSPAAQAAAISISTPEMEVGDPLAAVEAAQKREDAEWQCEPVDPEAVAAAKAEALAAGSTLGDDGRIACPEALCQALGLSRSIYQHVLSQYADGGPRDRDRPRRLAPSALGLPRQSATERMLRALMDAGDVRFARRNAHLARLTERVAQSQPAAGAGDAG